MKVRLKYLKLWVIVDIDTRKVVSFYITSGRSGVDVYKIINQLGKDVTYIHDKGPWYNMLDWQKVPNKHEKFGIRNVIEQIFRVVKHRLASMDKHFPARSTEETITRWMRIFFTIYNEFIQFISER